MSDFIRNLLYLRDREIEILSAEIDILRAEKEIDRLKTENELEKLNTALAADRPPPQMPHPTFEPRKADYSEILKAK
jgi:hypothetical protein